MDLRQIAKTRLQSQQIESPTQTSPEEVVSWLLAMQAQDYAGAKWSIGIRLPGSTDSQVEQAIGEKSILRSWILRGTLHFATAEDIRWLVDLVGPRMIAGNKRRYRELELDEKTLIRSNDLLILAVEKSESHTRKSLLAMLRQKGIPTEGQRGVYMLQRASLEGLICQGSTRANDPIFLKMDEFPLKKMSRADALAELSIRYFSSRGPATLPDFTWWSGLTAAEARAGLEFVRSRLSQATIDGISYWSGSALSPQSESKNSALLLPGFDEFLIAYKDRRASLDVPNYNRLTPANGMLPGTMVIDGKVVGTWKRTFRSGSVVVACSPFAPISSVDQKKMSRAASELAKYLQLPLEITQSE
jgi:hypothetical protein